MTETVIVAGARTPIGKFSGGLADFSGAQLGGFAIRAVLERAGLSGDEIDYVIMGQVLQAGTGQITARQAANGAGIPMTVPALTINKVCLSGLNAIALADQLIRAGEVERVVAGGMESMTNAPYLAPKMRFGARMGDANLIDSMMYDGLFCAFDQVSMGEGTENYSKRYDLNREEQDEFAARSHALAAKAIETGKFDDEIVPVEVPQRRGDPVLVSRDEGVRPDATPETLGKLRTLMPGGTVTAGNASQQNDAAAACLVVAEDQLGALGLEPAGFLAGWAAAGCEPATMGIGPVPAVAKLFARTGLSWDVIDLVELNEAFAAQVLAVLAAWRWNDPEKLNVNGSGISLGHPIGATGVRMLATGLSELRRRGGRYLLETMCVGGGQGMAAAFETA
jgi:acetyl-CoA C-acetyltransferase